ncbi:unnamed protein product [Rotaria sordida]|uniref:EGF-like calcium-binding domain-containing protein n=1 Tax=Rotaria sordida TaxID=392033 RepID=A0A813Y739_9BILA|nr:unnamed protein product [Rotaria sordida]
MIPFFLLSDETFELCRTVPCNSTNRFRCTNGRYIYRCDICDHTDNCDDGSDEDIYDVYTIKSTRIVCPRNTRYKYNKESFTCEDINEYENVTLNYCSQICVNKRGSFRCECATGFQRSAVNRSDCYAGDQTIDLMISEPDEIGRLCRNPIENASHYDVFVEDQHDTSFISIDINNRIFYWIGEAASKIYHAHLTPNTISTVHLQVLLNEDNNHLIIPSSITIDWISQNLYVSGLIHGCI